MATCQMCLKHFHACSSCCLTHQWEYLFCCERCYNDFLNGTSNSDKEFVYSLSELDFLKLRKYYLEEMQEESFEFYLNERYKEIQEKLKTIQEMKEEGM